VKTKWIVLIISIIILLILYNIISLFIEDKFYDSNYFNIEVIKSEIDYNENGIDDYTDIVNGAILEGKKRPTYRSKYYSGGYPPEDEGVCTDLIWRSLKYAGYDLKEMIDKDIEENIEEYPRIKVQDKNIDFRRVYNLHVFLKRNTLSLTVDINKIDEFQPGDILVFEKDKHIGIVSNKRNKKGIPYLLHHTSSMINYLSYLEEDILEDYKIIGHFRFKLKDK